MLASDLTNIEKEIRRTENAQIEWLHIDVMDGVFVDNITYGNNVVAAMRKVSNIYFDTHLMVTDPTNLIPLFALAGSNMLTIHLESKGDTTANLKYIKKSGMNAGLAIKPATDWKEVIPYLPLCDMVLVMTVEPGYGGQGFIPQCADKVAMLRKYCNENGFDKMNIQVDGGHGNRRNSERCRCKRTCSRNISVQGEGYERSGRRYTLKAVGQQLSCFVCKQSIIFLRVAHTAEIRI